MQECEWEGAGGDLKSEGEKLSKVRIRNGKIWLGRRRGVGTRSCNHNIVTALLGHSRLAAACSSLRWLACSRLACLP